MLLDAGAGRPLYLTNCSLYAVFRFAPISFILFHVIEQKD